jgi:hypothetical protein
VTPPFLELLCLAQQFVQQRPELNLEDIEFDVSDRDSVRPVIGDIEVATIFGNPSCAAQTRCIRYTTTTAGVVIEIEMALPGRRWKYVVAHRPIVPTIGTKLNCARRLSATSKAQ